MPLAGDFRPYFIIHDEGHVTLINRDTTQARLLLGMTNPFHDETCKHWPSSGNIVIGLSTQNQPAPQNSQHPAG